MGAMGNGKRLSDGENYLKYPLTAIDTRLLKYPFTIPYPIRNKKETNPARDLTIPNRCANIGAWI